MTLVKSDRHQVLERIRRCHLCTKMWNYVKIFCTTCSQRGSSSVSTSWRWSSWSPTQLSRSCTCLLHKDSISIQDSVLIMFDLRSSFEARQICRPDARQLRECGCHRSWASISINQYQPASKNTNKRASSHEGFLLVDLAHGDWENMAAIGVEQAETFLGGNPH